MKAWMVQRIRSFAARAERVLFSQMIETQAQQRLQLKRLQYLLEQQSATGGRSVERETRDDREDRDERDAEFPELTSRAAGGNGQAAATSSPGPASAAGSTVDDMLVLAACPVCGCRERTLVSEYNKLITLESTADEAVKRYDYSVCHSCGVVFAARRPVGDRFRGLLSRFSESIGRASPTLVLSPDPLGPAEQQQLLRMVEKGVFVSEHLDVPKKEYLSGVFRDRLAVSPHIELIGSLLTLDRPKVLEIRPRFGSILDALRRRHQAEIWALPMFESQRYLMHALYGIEASALIDFDRFSIPYDVKFDLIVCNHMFTHILRPAEFFRCLQDHLAPGGHIYLYNEPDEVDYLAEGKSMIAVLNPFHVQAFGKRALVRALKANGFETVFLAHHDKTFICLARATPGVSLSKREAITKSELETRVQAYRRARDGAVLRLPAAGRAYFAADWDAIVERAVVEGAAEVDIKGRVKARKPLSDDRSSDADGAGHSL